MRFTLFKRLRLERNLLQIELAQRAKMNVARLSQIENAHVTPKLEEMERLAVALDVPLRALSGSAKSTGSHA
jgi:transcriptional regulator with XRE-family HTH domain